MTWITEPLELEFMQRALLAGVLVAATTGVAGTWVVVRGLTFMGDALAHGVLPGIALAFLWGINPIFGAVVSGLLMVAGVNFVTHRARVSDDVAIGLLFVGMLAAGVVIISKSDSFSTALEGFLFGEFLGVTEGDIWVGAAAAAGAVVATVLLYRVFLAAAIDPVKAELLGLRPQLGHFAMLALIALAVVTSFRAVGTLLVFALLVGPPATASLVTRRVPAMIVVAILIGAASVVVGLLVSFHAGTAAAATVATTAVGAFFVVLVGAELGSALRRS